MERVDGFTDDQWPQMLIILDRGSRCPTVHLELVSTANVKRGDSCRSDVARARRRQIGMRLPTHVSSNPTVGENPPMNIAAAIWRICYLGGMFAVSTNVRARPRLWTAAARLVSSSNEASRKIQSTCGESFAGIK